MSACGEFAEHVWKPGSCKNCFHPRSAHRPGDNVASIRTGAAGSEDDGLTSTPCYCKPTIAVRPTMMNPEAPDPFTDVNLNTEQGNRKNSIDKASLKKLLEISPLCMDSNGFNKSLKEAVLQNTSLTKTEFPQLGSPLAPMSTTGVFVTQDDGLRPNGTRDHTLSSTCIRNCADPPKGSVQKLDERTACELYNERCDDSSSCSPLAREHNGPLQLSVGLVSQDKVSSGNHEAPSVSSCPGSVPEVELQISEPCGRASSLLSEPASFSDSCSYRSSTDSLACSQGLDVFRRSGSESPQAFASPASPWSDAGNRLPRAEPIYAESSKRKRKPLDQSQMGRSLDQTAELSGEPQRAKITVMAAQTEDSNVTFYLSSPDSAVSTQWTRFSPDSARDPISPAFRWPSGSDATLSPNQAKPQSSPPIPPKRTSRSPKLGTSSLSAALHQEVPPEACVSARSPSRAHTQTHDKPQEDPASAAPSSLCSERRHQLHCAHWDWKARIEEEEEEEEGRAEGVASCLVNGAAVQEPRSWSPVAPGEEKLPPGTGNNGASHGSHGSSAKKEKQTVDMLMRVPSSSCELAEGRRESPDPTPPPPPPKKHHRPSNKMSQSSLELERASQQGSVESLTQSLRALSGSLASASSDSLHGESKAFPDGGCQDHVRVGSPCLFSSSPLTSSPVSPRPESLASVSPDRVQPPPLPEKKLLSRTVSAPGGPGGRLTPRVRPRLPFGGSESNVCCPERARSGHPSSPVEPRAQYSSSESLERCPPPLSRSLRSQTLDETPNKGWGRLRGGVTSSSSPQLSVLLPSPSVATGGGSSLHLQNLLSNIDSREGVYSKLGGLYAESLRRLALKCEEHFTRGQRNPLHFDESNWSLFKLTCNKPSCDAGDAVYYSASCASDPGTSYAVKICKSRSAEGKQADVCGLLVQQNMPPHFNLQQDCGHFIACVPQSMLAPDEARGERPGRGEQERVVVITRDTPRCTAADFVRDGTEPHRVQPEAYERRVCFLLLQLCNGLEHLKEHGVSHRDLCLENLLLVPAGGRDGVELGGSEQAHLPRLVISSFGKSKQRSAEDSSATTDPRLRRDHARLAPEIVSASQYRKFDEFQTGILIYELLHQPNPFEMSPELKEQDYCCEELPPIPALSIYSPGLQRLARLLLQPDPIKRLAIQEAKRALQCLLWGPRRDLVEQQWERPGRLPRHEALLNWLDVKRALLMMKFAERSLEPDRDAELEDWLCCQYFSCAHPLALCHTASQLYLK